MSSSIAVPGALAPRRAWLTDLPVLLVAVVWGASYLAAKDITTAETVLAVLVLRFAVVLRLVVAGLCVPRALTPGPVARSRAARADPQRDLPAGDVRGRAPRPPTRASSSASP
ncbi:hypothetical protein SGLAM104S_10338 [Streptomyces glaucescens]